MSKVTVNYWDRETSEMGITREDGTSAILTGVVLLSVGDGVESTEGPLEFTLTVSFDGPKVE